MKFLERIQRFFTGQTKMTAPPQNKMQAEKSKMMMQKILGMLSETQEEELTCDQVFAVIDEFVEMEERGEDVRAFMPLIQHHLQMCADCMEEYNVLKKIVKKAVPL